METNKSGPTQARTLSFSLGTLETLTLYVSVFIVFFFMVSITANVLSRFIFNRPILGIEDVVQSAMVLLVALALSAAEKADRNLSVTFLTDRMGKFGKKVLAAGYLLGGVVCGMIAVSNLLYAFETMRMNDVTMTIHWVTWPVRLGLSLGFGMIAVRFVIKTVAAFRAGPRSQSASGEKKDDAAPTDSAAPIS